MVDAPSPSAGPAQLLDTAAGRRIVFVVGSGRSGTSTLSGSLQALGMHVPQPEVDADETNPKGFGEPQWVVDFHDELLRRANVAVSDARPSAWFEAGKLNNVEPVRRRLQEWMEQQFVEGGPELVVKDPRLAWFMGLWRGAALRCDAQPGYVTMLRPVTEVVGSKQRYYDARFGEVNRTAAWVNMMLHCERATRGFDRAFVRYHDLLDDWTVPVFGLGQRFDLDAVKSAAANDIRKVHAYIDPSLRRVRLTWDDLDVPRRLRAGDLGGARPAPRRRRRHPRGPDDARPAARGLRGDVRGGRGDQPVHRARLAPRGLRRGRAVDPEARRRARPALGPRARPGLPAPRGPQGRRTRERVSAA